MSHETHCDTYPGSNSNGQLANKTDEVSMDGKVGKNSSVIDIADSMNVWVAK